MEVRTVISHVSFNKNRKRCFCTEPEKIENYDKAISDTDEIWACHHRLETHNSDGERRLVDLSIKELQALDMYYDRPASELIFIKPSEHSTLHNSQGLNSHSKEYAKAYHQSHREERLIKSRAYHQTHKQEISVRHREYLLKNKEKIHERQKNYNSHKCFYNGRELTFSALRKRFYRDGVEHPSLEAKKYLIREGV